MPHRVEDLNFPCPSALDALTVYCCKLRLQIRELTEECERLRAEIRRLRGEENGRMYSIDQAKHFKTMKGDLW